VRENLAGRDRLRREMLLGVAGLLTFALFFWQA